MRRLLPLCLCLLLNLVPMIRADPVPKHASTASSATHNGPVHISVPPVPRAMPPSPITYLLTPPVPPGSGPAWRSVQEDVLHEAAFRYLFGISPYSRHLPVYYISLKGFPWGRGTEASRDPDAAFLMRFHGNKPLVQAVSALPASSKDWDNQAKHHWIIFRVSSIQWVSDTKIEIACGSARSGFISSDSLFLDCTLHNGWWEITGASEVSV